MITDQQKQEIDKKYFPNGYFYKTKNFNPYSLEQRLDDDFENIESYESSVKYLRHSNALRFYYNIRYLSKTDFVNEINNQFLNYVLENEENAELWLSLTYDLVLKGFSVAGKIEDISLTGAFIEWYNLKITETNTKPHLNNENEKPQQNKNKFCKAMPLNIPKEHFKILTEKNSKNGRPFLTQDQFNIFIERAFLGRTDLPMQKFNQAPKGEKFKIQYLFRQFYENYCIEYFNTGQTQDIFINLLTDNFIGWTFENVKDNFKTKPKNTL